MPCSLLGGNPTRATAKERWAGGKWDGGMKNAGGDVAGVLSFSTRLESKSPFRPVPPGGSDTAVLCYPR